MGASDVRCRKRRTGPRFRTYRPKSWDKPLKGGGTSSAEQPQRPTAAKTEGEAAPSTRRGRRRIGRRCGCLPGAWVETGHAAMPRPGKNRGCNPLPHEPKHRKTPLPRPGGRLPSVHRGRSTRSPRPRQAAIPPADPCRGSRPAATARPQWRAERAPSGTSCCGEDAGRGTCALRRWYRSSRQSPTLACSPAARPAAGRA